MQRFNWTIHDRPDLFQPTGGARRAHEVPPARYGESLWLRVERQTLRRLPRAGDVLFTIRTYRTPLETLAPVRFVVLRAPAMAPAALRTVIAPRA